MSMDDERKHWVFGRQSSSLRTHNFLIPEVFFFSGASTESRSSESSSNSSNASPSPTHDNTNKPTKLALDKSCGSCGSRLSVKFDLDAVDSPDRSKWVLFSCPRCKYDLCREEEGGEREDGVEAGRRRKGELARRGRSARAAKVR